MDFADRLRRKGDQVRAHQQETARREQAQRAEREWRETLERQQRQKRSAEVFEYFGVEKRAKQLQSEARRAYGDPPQGFGQAKLLRNNSSWTITIEAGQYEFTYRNEGAYNTDTTVLPSFTLEVSYDSETDRLKIDSVSKPSDEWTLEDFEDELVRRFG